MVRWVMRVSQALGRIFDWLTDAMAVLAGAVLMFVLVSTTVAVVFRYFLRQPLAWTVEFSEYGLLFASFLGTTWLLRNEGHVTVSILTERLQSRTQTLLRLTWLPLGLALCIILFWFSLETTLEALRKEIMVFKVVSLPKYVLQAVIPLGFLFLSIQFLRMVTRAVGAVLPTHRSFRSRG